MFQILHFLLTKTTEATCLDLYVAWKDYWDQSNRSEKLYRDWRPDVIYRHHISHCLRMEDELIQEFASLRKWGTAFRGRFTSAEEEDCLSVFTSIYVKLLHVDRFMVKMGAPMALLAEASLVMSDAWGWEDVTFASDIKAKVSVNRWPFDSNAAIQDISVDMEAISIQGYTLDEEYRFAASEQGEGDYEDETSDDDGEHAQYYSSDEYKEDDQLEGRLL